MPPGHPRTGAPGDRVYPWAVSLDTGYSAAAGVLTVTWFATRSRASIQEQELFDEIVSPTRADAARWLREWD